ncbi:acyl carrier protein [Amycolatopsis sp. NPDC005003]
MPDEDRAVIRDFVTRHVGGAEVTDDEDIFASGYVNSLFAVQLVMWIERTFDVAMTGTDLDLAHLRSIDRITRFVASRRAAVAQP